MQTVPGNLMRPTLDPEFYYLSNFHQALNWLQTRYADLLLTAESEFIDDFFDQPLAAQALLVRMIMRKGEHFRASKLNYNEIGDTLTAARPLLAKGWITDAAEMDIDTLSNLLRKDEIFQHLDTGLCRKTAAKTELLEYLQANYPHTSPFKSWCPTLADAVFSLTISEMCDRFRLMFFGNLHQDWTELVLADLGIFRYEPVELTPDSRAFRQRSDVDAYLHLSHCREQFDAGLPVAEVLALIDQQPYDNAFLLARRDKLSYRLAQQLERESDWAGALAVYRQCHYPGARLRHIRVLERLEQRAAAHKLALLASAAPESAAEAQNVERILTRLNRQLGLPKACKPTTAPVNRIDLILPKPDSGSVETAVLEHFSSADAPVFYVENGLISSLFGLLCWEAVFAPISGAFFHPFHSAPVDLHSPDFYTRRQALFDESIGLLDSDAYIEKIQRTFANKLNTQSPFVFWGLLDQALLTNALLCLPTEHLRAWFRRMLQDIKANRAGMPDLIQFWPKERRYRMIEVKGPGDRLQDNQIRWLSFCSEHGMPVDVCYVQWAAA
ncbi:MAG: VRR-NUC domain-containing protein [Pseudomonas marincola]|uniref:VRR-NUC domain-containing protein n=1 Tax=Pseudomonas marincola TaxID=437900 RepID=UPI003001CB60